MPPLAAAHPVVRWTAPLAALAVIGTGALVSTRSAQADAGLPPKSAQQLLVDLQGARLDGLSGTVEQKADLGLPNLPGLGKAGQADLSSVLTGTHTWRVWTAGPTQAKLALTGELSESTIVRNGSDLWIWSSRDKTVVHRTLPAHDAGSKRGGPGTKPGAPDSLMGAGPTDLPRTPDEAARRVLQALEPTTEVSTSGTSTVAGRPAYDLVLKPRNPATLVAEVRVAVDAEKSVPLRVQVYSTKIANPAFEVGFVGAVDFARPAASTFAFTPPPGATVTEAAVPTAKPGSAAGKPSPGAATGKPRTVGTGWATVAVATVPQLSATDPQGRQLQAMLGAIPRTSGTWGSGRLLTGTLFSALLTDDGRLAVGAVAPESLYAALAAK